MVATSKELQELDITPLLDECENRRSTSWLNNRTELDISLNEIKKDVLKVSFKACLSRKLKEIFSIKLEH